MCDVVVLCTVHDDVRIYVHSYLLCISYISDNTWYDIRIYIYIYIMYFVIYSRQSQ